LNSLEKKSFYSFLTLYIGSSFLFVMLSGFWYYKSQENSLDSTTYYKLQHYADTIAGLIINAQMHNTKLVLPKLEDGYEYYLIKTDEGKTFQENYFKKDGFSILISSSTQEHLNVEYVVVKTREYFQKLQKLQEDVLLVMFFVFVIIVIISIVLSKLFMRPIHQKVLQIEQFVQDISHELNTPITALKMSTSRAMKKAVCDDKTLKNISISTKQLYTIYKSLAYLNFSSKQKEPSALNLKNTINEVVEFYAELTQAKNITIKTYLEDAVVKIDEDKAKLLFSNLLSNAIKYSMPNKTITLTLTKDSFVIKDEGIGIKKEKLDEIFKLYERGSDIAGGFGVGLSIVKQVCDEFDIKVKVNSKLGEGSSFILRFSN
jgi:two-component system OmpR family sensor kinase